ncbi:Crp/Fnr family transcriptional regulator [Chryseobacterium sp.]|jgi:CRP-like cAMP-binding protein|uniref:Crp/Fnr family transcriptional regulator n=1 Tax=Chryseobacterium sp. TaxID=1871047 RepID=UPI0028402FDF|nr:Crp/Fnr family transcriptional regulator [Chryseobacterium sp.]MDR3022969.1 Crp/Fnr family transcriptional regulator [Chryseobacterium sp.]
MLHIFTAINSYISSILDNKDTPPVSLSLEGMMAIFTKLHKEELPKNNILVKPGHICRHIYFIEKGAARIFYYKDEKDVTDGFRGEETLLLSIISFIRQKPDKRGIELLDDCVLWKLSYDDLEELSEKFPDIQYLYRMIMSSVLIMTQNRIDRMLFQTAEERYDDFIKSHPRAAELLTLGMIASFLGITQETLSRIRSKK